MSEPTASDDRYAMIPLPRVRQMLAQARAEEREACAAIADADLLGIPDVTAPAAERWDNGGSERCAKRIAAAIRARGETNPKE